MSLEIRNERDDLRLRVKELEYQTEQLWAVLKELWDRHNDGSPEQQWAEWDAAQDLLEFYGRN